MKIDDKYRNESLNHSLEIYHKLIDNGIMQPRGNQLNRSGTMPKVIRFNVPKQAQEMPSSQPLEIAVLLSGKSWTANLSLFNYR